MGKSTAKLAKLTKLAKLSTTKTKDVTRKRPEFTTTKIDTLVAQLIDDNALNNLVALLEMWQTHVPEVLAKGGDDEATARHLVGGLFKLFNHLIRENRMALPKHKYDEKKAVAVKWLNKQYSTFIDNLLLVVQQLNQAPSLTVDACDVLMQLVKAETEAHYTEAFFAEKPLRRVRQAVLALENPAVVAWFAEEYLSPYFDLRFYWFHNLAPEITEAMFDNYLVLVEHLRELKDQQFAEKQLPSRVVPEKFRAHFQEATLAVLTLPQLTHEHYQRIMANLHKRIIPHMHQPHQLMDFLTHCYHQGGDLPLLTLSSLWELMKHHNLEYPDFYTKLYALLTPEMMALTYRPRFMRLCELFLSSTHLSAQLVALFIKRLARLTLTAPVPATVAVVPFVYNLLKAHPTVMVMIHRPEGGADEFNADETNPLKTGAISSLVWELEALTSHYHPHVATLARIYSEPFRKLRYNMEDFYDWDYSQLVQQEQRKRYKAAAALEFEERGVYGAGNYLEDWVA